MYKIKILPVRENSIKAGHIPKYTIQVQHYEDGRFRKNIKQDDQLIEELNLCLKRTPLSLSGNELPFEESCMTCSGDTTTVNNPCCGLFDQ